ncbi:MAG: NAD-dependent epimerase/dehydratase family protein [Pseudomonadales bacterium]|nr:NAD-dependent epimerase/dehydratase family protein [Pseudomonadales bacterium]
MTTTILVTGACGNIGQNVLKSLSSSDCAVKVLDLGTPNNKAVAQAYPDVEFFWADINDKEGVAKALQGVDTVIHLIGIIPPLSESNPALAHKVNVEGTRTLVEAMEASSTAKRLVFTSSFAVLGIGNGTNRIHTADMPYKESDTYSATKIACEKLIHQSDLVWTILRLAAIPNVDPSAHNIKDMALSLKIGPKDFVEFCHARDVAKALTSAAVLDEAQAKGKTFMIGGGDGCRFTGYEFTSKLFTTAGVGAISERFYAQEPSFYAGWVDSESSNAILDYQGTTFDDFLLEFRQGLGTPKYLGARLVAPIIRLVLMIMAKRING